jgi:hypothetical protein
MIITKRDINDISGAELYLRRWSLWLPGGWSVKLHKIVKADDDRCQHDHPWNFLRIILWGGYVEERGSETFILKPWRPWAPWRIYPVRGNFKHRIDHLLCNESWSLVFCGPRYRQWGFFTKAGWVMWRLFVDEAASKRILWCEDGRTLNDT